MRTRPPPLPPGYVPPPKHRFRRGKAWRRYGPDTVERARALVEGTTWPEAAIAARVGIATSTVGYWKVRRGWRRPPGTSVSTRKVGVKRAGFTRRCREALRQLEWLAARAVWRIARAEPVDRAALARALALASRARRGSERRNRKMRPSRPGELGRPRKVAR